jgi:hypothetical protein
MAASATATVTPLNATADPAVAMASSTASTLVAPAIRSSRHRVVMRRA